mgnify:CR=1 FL=1
MNTNDHHVLKRELDALADRLEKAATDHDKYGVLDGAARLRAREAAIEVARLREQIEHFGDADEARHATDAADLAAVRTQIDYWTALLDRNFRDQQR